MTEQSGEDYLNELETSSDPADKVLAARIREGMKTKVAESPLDVVQELKMDLDQTPASTAKKPKNASS